MLRDIHLCLRANFSTLKICIAPFFAVAIAFAFFAVTITLVIAITITVAEIMYFGAAVDKLHDLIHTAPTPGYPSPFRLDVKFLNEKLTQLSANQSKLDPCDDDAKPEEDIPHQLLPETCLGIQSSTLDQNTPSHLQYCLQVGWNVDSMSEWHSKGCTNSGVDRNS